MYIRYIAKFFNRQTGRVETGIFRAADYVRDFSAIDAAEKESLQKIISWFDEYLPVPEFYDDPAKRSEELHTYFWFKTSAGEFLEQMERLSAILKNNGVRVEALHAEKISGTLVFEDHCQIAITRIEDFLSIK